MAFLMRAKHCPTPSRRRNFNPHVHLVMLATAVTLLFSILEDGYITVQIASEICQFKAKNMSLRVSLGLEQDTDK